MSLLSATRTLLRRSPSAWLRAAGTVALAGVVEIGLRTVTLPRLARALKVHVVLDGSPTALGDLSAVRLTPRERERLDITWRVLRHRPFNGTCLRRSLLGARVLRHRDHAVRIGVQKVDGVVKAHAWLELDGVVLDPDGVEGFKVLASKEPA